MALLDEKRQESLDVFISQRKTVDLFQNTHKEQDWNHSTIGIYTMVG